MDAETDTLIREVLQWNPESDVDDKGNYPDGMPPADPKNPWDLFEAPHFAGVDLGLFAKFALVKGTTKFRVLLDGENRLTLFVSGPKDLGLVWWSGNVGKLTGNDKQLVRAIILHCPAIGTDNYRKRTAETVRLYMNI